MVMTGLDVLLTELIGELRGLKVAILANHASVTRGLVHISDAFKNAGIDITAMFGPEHGVRGNHADGISVPDWIDERLGIPVHSLYGQHCSPRNESLQDVDILLIDLQDVGSRFYTYAHTVAKSLQACAENNIPVWVLDRPNPINGVVVEGPVRYPDYFSNVGMFSGPIRHGLTIGELARVFAREMNCESTLKVIKMRNWKQEMWYDDTQLPWVMPSPNMPSVATATVYPGLCLIEGTNVSEGRGTTRPFELIGAPWINPYILKEQLTSLNLPGTAFREAFFTPTSSKYKAEQCAGIQIHITDRNTFMPVLTGISIISTLRKLHKEFDFRATPEGGRCFFDLLAGSSTIREMILSGESPDNIMKSWQTDLSKYKSSLSSIKIY